MTYGSWSNDVADPGTDRDRSMKSQLAKIAADPTLAKIPSAVLHTPNKTSFIMDELVGRELSERAKISLPAEYREATNSFSESYDYGIVVDDKSIAHQDGDPDVIRGVLVTPETIENRNAHHDDTDEISIAGLKKVIGLHEALAAVEELATDFRRRYHAQSRVY